MPSPATYLLVLRGEKVSPPQPLSLSAELHILTHQPPILGFEICSNKAGFAAGLVYGIFTIISRVLIVFSRGPTVSDSRTSMMGSTTRVRNNFESYTVVDPGDRRTEGVFTNSWTFLGQTRSNSYGSSYSVGSVSGTGLFIGNQRVG